MVIILTLINISLLCFCGYIWYQKKRKNEICKKLQEDYQLLLDLNLRLKHKLKEKIVLDQETRYRNKVLRENNEILKTTYEEWMDKIKKIEELTLEQTKHYERYKISIENLQEEIRNNYENSIKEYQEEYQQVLSFAAKDLVDTLQSLQEQLLDAKQKQDSIIAIAKKKMEEENQRKYHMIQITEEELKEIQSLRQVGKILKNPTPLNKVIWKTYYEKPTSLLIGRIFGQSVVSGIYKITNIENNMCYIGQSVNIAERFKQHIKRGLGAETPTKAKLYSAMEEYGVENFTFEIIDKCEPKQLNAREKYWIDFYHGVDFGYNSTSGNN